MSSDEYQLPAFLAMLWERDDTQRPGPKRGLDLRAIGCAAVDVADTHGLSGVSMAKVAAALGVTTMALYRYVSSKDELLKLMVDTAYGPATLRFSDGDGWRDRIRSWSNALQGSLVRHRWILRVPVSEPPLTPHQIGWMDMGLQAFNGTPLTAQDKLSALLLVDNYIRGVTQLSVDITSNDPDFEAGERYVRGLTMLADPARFPALAAVLAEGGLSDDDDEDIFPTAEFNFGLDTVFDGIAVLIERRAGAKVSDRLALPPSARAANTDAGPDTASTNATTAD
jgi:AcrR family transcriptional regulator